MHGSESRYERNAQTIASDVGIGRTRKFSIYLFVLRTNRVKRDRIGLDCIVLRSQKNVMHKVDVVYAWNCLMIPDMIINILHRYGVRVPSNVFI